MIFTIHFGGFPPIFWFNTHILQVFSVGISAPTLQELMSLGGEAFSTWQGEISAILEQVGKGHEERSPRLGFVG